MRYLYLLCGPVIKIVERAPDIKEERYINDPVEDPFPNFQRESIRGGWAHLIRLMVSRLDWMLSNSRLMVEDNLVETLWSPEILNETIKCSRYIIIPYSPWGALQTMALCHAPRTTCTRHPDHRITRHVPFYLLSWEVPVRNWIGWIRARALSACVARRNRIWVYKDSYVRLCIVKRL